MMVQEFHLSHHNTYLPVVPLRSIFDHLCPRLAEEPSPSRKKDADIAPSGGDPGLRTTLTRIAPPQGTDAPERRRGEVRGPGREGIRSPEKRGSAVRCSFRPAGHVTIRKTGPRCSPTRRESLLRRARTRGFSGRNGCVPFHAVSFGRIVPPGRNESATPRALALNALIRSRRHSAGVAGIGAV